MNPTTRVPEEYGQDDEGRAPGARPPHSTLTPDFGPPAPALARTVQLVAGDLLLTVNPVDGSEIGNCPPHQRPGRPGKRAAAERAGLDGAARPPVPPGPARPPLPLVAREDERERLVRLLARGRSVRLTGPAGSGRTAILDLVAEDCADLAPDGVVRLSGYRRTTADLLFDLFTAVHKAPLHRPAEDRLLELVREIGAVVVIDDLEFGGRALDVLLDATPECAFLLAATPGVPAPSADSPLEEVFLRGLDRAASVELLERAVGRVLTEEESNWAGDLWFESEGLPLRFVQAGALLRQRDRLLRAGVEAVDEFDAEDTDDPPLPSLAEGAAPAALLASRLSESARNALRFAVALDGEVPHQSHLPALVADTQADAALAELVCCALVTRVGSRYRLAAGVLAQLATAGYAEGAEERAVSVAQHYAWWAGHPSVTPERVVAESGAVLAALAVVVPLTVAGLPAPAEQEGLSASAEGGENPAVRLARQAAPAFAAGLQWSAWERALRSGAEAARLAGDVGQQGYFHHELGILALCLGQLERARAELDASIGLRGALADKRGMLAGRRALALVSDRSWATPPGGRTAAGEGVVPDAWHDESASPAGGVPSGSLSGFGPVHPSGGVSTLVTHQAGAGPAKGGGDRLVDGARRNLVAAGAGALLAVLLGTVVTLGATSDNSDTPSERVGVNPSASAGVDDDGLDAERPTKGSNDDPGAAAVPTDPGADGTYGKSDDPTPTTSSDPSNGSSGTERPERPTRSPSPSRTSERPSDDPTSGHPSDDPTTDDPTDDPTTDDPTDDPTDNAPTGDPPPPDTTNSASEPASGAPVTSSSASAPDSSAPDSPSGSTNDSSVI